MEAEPTEENDDMEIENFLEKAHPEEEDEDMQCRMSPLSHSYSDMRDNFPEPTESSRRNEGNDEIMEVLMISAQKVLF